MCLTKKTINVKQGNFTLHLQHFTFTSSSIHIVEKCKILHDANGYCYLKTHFALSETFTVVISNPFESLQLNRKLAYSKHSSSSTFFEVK